MIPAMFVIGTLSLAGASAALCTLPNVGAAGEDRIGSLVVMPAESHALTGARADLATVVADGIVLRTGPGHWRVLGRGMTSAEVVVSADGSCNVVKDPLVRWHEVIGRVDCEGTCPPDTVIRDEQGGKAPELRMDGAAFSAHIGRTTSLHACVGVVCGQPVVVSVPEPGPSQHTAILALPPRGGVGVECDDGVITGLLPQSPLNGVVPVGARVVAVDGASSDDGCPTALLLGPPGSTVRVEVEAAGVRSVHEVRRIPLWGGG